MYAFLASADIQPISKGLVVLLLDNVASAAEGDPEQRVFPLLWNNSGPQEQVIKNIDSAFVFQSFRLKLWLKSSTTFNDVTEYLVKLDHFGGPHLALDELVDLICDLQECLQPLGQLGVILVVFGQCIQVLVDKKFVLEGSLHGLDQVVLNII